jgi:hypothetical protein
MIRIVAKNHPFPSSLLLEVPLHSAFYPSPELSREVMDFLTEVDVLASAGEIGLQEGIIERETAYYPYFEDSTTVGVSEEV